MSFIKIMERHGASDEVPAMQGACPMDNWYAQVQRNLEELTASGYNLPPLEEGEHCPHCNSHFWMHGALHHEPSCMRVAQCVECRYAVQRHDGSRMHALMCPTEQGKLGGLGHRSGDQSPVC